MSTNDRLDREMEHTLRGYFASRSRELEAPADTWARLERRLDEPRAGWFGSHMWKALTAATGTAVAAVLVIAAVNLASQPSADAPANQLENLSAALPMAQPTAAPPAAQSVAPVPAPTAAYKQPTPAAAPAPTPAAPAPTPAAAPTAAPAPQPTPVVALAQRAQAVPTPAAQTEAITRAAAAAGAASSPGDSAQPFAEPPRAPVARPGAVTFADYARQSAVLASEDAVSTFSLDVDRTSYFLALEWARAGYRVDPDSVRAEEWTNAFDYGYPPPSDEWGFGVQTDLAVHPLDSGLILARIGFQAPHLPDDRPLNVTLVLDASGSMADGNRVDIARAAADAIRMSLRPQDRIAVVHFTTNVVRELTVAHTRPYDQAVTASIANLFPRESTNVQAGLDEGVRLAHKARSVRPGGTQLRYPDVGRRGQRGRHQSVRDT